MVLGQILRPFTGRDDVETGSAGQSTISAINAG